MTRHLSHFATLPLPTRTVRIVRGRFITLAEMGSGVDRAAWVARMVWPTEEEWKRLVEERSAVRQ
jgi:hypothetical protein